MSAAAIGLDGWLYQLVLVLHIVAVIVGFGGVLLNGVYASQAGRRPASGALAVSESNYAVTMIAEKAIYAVPVLGIALVLLSDDGFGFGDTWIWLSLVIYLVAITASHTVLNPGHRKINELLAAAASTGQEPDAAVLAKLNQRQAGVGATLHLGLAAIIVLMVFKPGS